MVEMTGVKCNNCGKVFYPKRSRCPECKGEKMEEAKMGESATLLTYTELWAVPKGIEQIPLMLGIVQFDNGARALGQLTTRDVKIGEKFRPIWSMIRKINEKEVYGFKFEPFSKLPF